MPGYFPDYHEPSTPEDRVHQARSIDRSFSKQLFREMAKSEMENAQLSWQQRRRFVAFATRLGIDEFEAKLILRAVEYECGHAELAALDERATQARDLLKWTISPDRSNAVPFWLITTLAIAAGYICWQNLLR